MLAPGRLSRTAIAAHQHQPLHRLRVEEQQPGDLVVQDAGEELARQLGRAAVVAQLGRKLTDLVQDSRLVELLIEELIESREHVDLVIRTARRRCGRARSADCPFGERVRHRSGQGHLAAALRHLGGGARLHPPVEVPGGLAGGENDDGNTRGTRRVA